MEKMEWKILKKTFSVDNIVILKCLNKNIVRSGIRTHAHISGPEYSC